VSGIGHRVRHRGVCRTWLTRHANTILFDIALDQVKKKKNLSALSKLRLESFTEGKAAQIMYVRPFSEEGPTIANIHSYIKQKGYGASGKHHEIYLSDITKTAPDKLKTIIRQPVI